MEKASLMMVSGTLHDSLSSGVTLSVPNMVAQRNGWTTLAPALRTLHDTVESLAGAQPPKRTH